SSSGIFSRAATSHPQYGDGRNFRCGRAPQGHLKNRRSWPPQGSPVSWMQAGFDLPKIVHAFRWRETVLFEFVLRCAGPIRRVLPRSLYNEKIQSVGRAFRVPTDLKSTINLPKTAFPMKAGLPQNEPK